MQRLKHVPCIYFRINDAHALHLHPSRHGKVLGCSKLEGSPSLHKLIHFVSVQSSSLQEQVLGAIADETPALIVMYSTLPG